MSSRSNMRVIDKTLVAFVVALFLFISPVMHLWARPGMPWITPYVLWLIVIVLIAVAQRKHKNNEY